MVIQLSHNIILRSNRTWLLRRTRWQAFIQKGGIDYASSLHWEAMTDNLSADDMLAALIGMQFPQHDIHLLVNALNKPQTIPFNPAMGNVRPKISMKPKANDMQLSKEPVGLFNPERVQ